MALGRRGVVCDTSIVFAGRTKRGLWIAADAVDAVADGGFLRLAGVAGAARGLCIGAAAAMGSRPAIVVQVPLRSLAIRDVNSHDWLLESGNWNIEIAKYAGDPHALLQSVVVAEQRYHS